MEFTPGIILDGTVRSIASFGAFIDLPEGRSGLVHISEVAASYVTDIRQHLTEGQNVRVKLLSADARGRLSLSIKQAENPRPAPQKPAQHRAADSRPAWQDPGQSPRSEPRSVWQGRAQSPKPEPGSFEEKLKQFMADSNSKISGVRQYEHKTRSRKR